MNLKRILAKKSGRSKGSVTVRHQGGRQKRFLREIDFKRDKKDVWGKVESIEYDPNRNCEVALVIYEDGERLRVGLKLRHPGFYPRGGGTVEAHIEPCPQVRGLQLRERSTVTRISGISAVAGLP